MRQEVFELHLLLEAASVPGPLILVGQSLGGLSVRLYTEQYGSDVVGIVLVDPAHESAMLYVIPRGGWVRLRELATGRVVPSPRRTGSTQDTAEVDYLPEEFQQIYLSRQANPEPLGTRPLIVLGAGRRPPPPGTPDSLWKGLRQQRDEQVLDLARLSRNAKFVLDSLSGHNIQNDNPQIVARAIEEVLEAVLKGARVAP